jgi:hypothetical protein|nr:MAG TPA_asm: hypothetical protein [Caudoviricetes sp.]
MALVTKYAENIPVYWADTEDFIALARAYSTVLDRLFEDVASCFEAAINPATMARVELIELLDRLGYDDVGYYTTDELRALYVDIIATRRVMTEAAFAKHLQEACPSGIVVKVEVTDGTLNILPESPEQIVVYISVDRGGRTCAGPTECSTDCPCGGAGGCGGDTSCGLVYVVAYAKVLDYPQRDDNGDVVDWAFSYDSLARRIVDSFPASVRLLLDAILQPIPLGVTYAAVPSMVADCYGDGIEAKMDGLVLLTTGADATLKVSYAHSNSFSASDWIEAVDGFVPHYPNWRATYVKYEIAFDSTRHESGDPRRVFDPKVGGGLMAGDKLYVALVEIERTTDARIFKIPKSFVPSQERAQGQNILTLMLSGGANNLYTEGYLLHIADPSVYLFGQYRQLVDAYGSTDIFLDIRCDDAHHFQPTTGYNITYTFNETTYHKSTGDFIFDKDDPRIVTVKWDISNAGDSELTVDCRPGDDMGIKLIVTRTDPDLTPNYTPIFKIDKWKGAAYIDSYADRDQDTIDVRVDTNANAIHIENLASRFFRLNADAQQPCAIMTTNAATGKGDELYESEQVNPAGLKLTPIHKTRVGGTEFSDEMMAVFADAYTTNKRVLPILGWTRTLAKPYYGKPNYTPADVASFVVKYSSSRIGSTLRSVASYYVGIDLISLVSKSEKLGGAAGEDGRDLFIANVRAGDDTFTAWWSSLMTMPFGSLAALATLIDNGDPRVRLPWLCQMSNADLMTYGSFKTIYTYLTGTFYTSRPRWLNAFTADDFLELFRPYPATFH